MGTSHDLDRPGASFHMSFSSNALSSARFTPEEIADRLIPEDPQISPDGRHVAFTVRPAGKKGEHQERTIWLSRDGAPAVRFSSGTANDARPRWSPDSKRIAFLSDRRDRGKSRVYLIAIDGGEAQPLGELEGEISQLAWSPDGLWIAAFRKDPDTADDKRKKDSRDDAIVVETASRRQRVWIINATTGTSRQLTFGTRQVWSFAWSRDSEEIAVCTTEGYDDDAYCGEGDLWRVRAMGGLPRHVARFATPPEDPVFVEGGIVVRATQHWEDPVDSVYFVGESERTPRNLLLGYEGNIDQIVAIAENPKSVGLLAV